MAHKYNILTGLFLIIILLLLNIPISEAKEIVYINSDYDVAFAEQFRNLQQKAYDELSYQKIEGDFSFIMKSKIKNEFIKGYEINNTKFVFHLLICPEEDSACIFRINGVPTGAFRASTEEIEYLFKLNECYAMKITKVIFDYCGQTFCDYELDVYDIVDITIKRICPVLCGDNKCESNENSNSCPSDCPPVCGDNLCGRDENCKKDNCCDGSIVNLKTDVENCGKCGLECGRYEKCVGGACTPVCGDGRCIADETCILDNCCKGKTVNFDEDPSNCGDCGLICLSDQKCEYGKCVLNDYCGNGVCGSTENCASCPKDCGCKYGYECYTNQCTKSDCLANSDCTDGNACTTDVCSGKPLKCSNKKFAYGCSWNNECVSVGTRVGNFYCSETETMKIIEVTNSSCNNNYECEMNICSNNKCKQPSITKKALNWLKRILWFW